MAKRTTSVMDDDQEVSANALDALMETDYANLPEVIDTIPSGTWKLAARNAAWKDKTETQSAKALVFYIPSEPLSDVDPETLSQLGDYDFTNNQIVFTKYVENLRDIKALMQFIALHGVDLEGLSPKAALKKLRGKEIIASVGSRSYQGQFGTVNENTVSNFAKVGDEE
ncbi:MAG TPA: hypothetical protein VIY48_03185 [Candidatus Paceibacterota bacterium]